MQVQVPVVCKNTVNINPGDEFYVGCKLINYVRKTLKVRKIVETGNGIHVVFSDDTWRPLTTYNTTWWKV